MARPVIAFLSDFGTVDHYAGVMKGVALGICPEAILVDISHGIAPQDVLGGALELAASYRYFPTATIFVVVVDPGVGSARRAIAMEAGGYRFVGPDNGVLSLVGDEVPPQRVVELTNPAYALPVVSRTFEGRDRFAPAAAWLASGVDLGALGPVVVNWHHVALPRAAASEQAISGEVIRVDRFGNLITNIDRLLVDRLTAAAPVTTPVTVTIGTTRVGSIAATYADAPPGTLCALFGSSGRLEIAVSGGDAAARLEARTGTQVQVKGQ
jgi:S-adenosylmethionine hydrolase